MEMRKVIKGLECALGTPGRRDCNNCPYDEEFNCLGCIGVMNDAINLLREREWNILKEDANGIVHGLPGDDGAYLMTDGKDIWIDDYVNGVTDGIFLDSGRDIHDIKAWMYMPKLAK